MRHTSTFPRPLAALLCALALLAACGQRTPAQPTATPPLAATTISVDAPASGATIGSPFELRGRISAVPPGGQLSYRLLDAAGALVGSGALTVAGDPGGPGAFAAQASYSAAAGSGRVEVVDFDPSGATRAIASVPVSFAGTLVVVPTAPPTAAPTATPEVQPTSPAQPTPPPAQAITFSSPPPGTEVGSPMTITGRTARFPFGGVLIYRVSDGAGRQLGNGSFGVRGAPDGPGDFAASLSFTLPQGGGPIRLELFDQNPQSGAVVATAMLDLRVAPPQAITFETPAPGTQVGSPVTITGRTARYPFQGNLAYRFLDGSGAQLGAGIFPVQGQPGAPARFTASLAFALPPSGGRVRVELVDQDATSGTVAARAALDLAVAPPSQAIVIETPAPGTQVGSPMTITGRTVRFPPQGRLGWRIRDAAGTQIGAGELPVTREPSGAGRFVASLSFGLPPGGGPIGVELLDIDPASGAVVASATLTLVVGATGAPQTITIDTPARDTTVGSPVTLTGRTSRYPAQGKLRFLVRSQAGATLGEGEFFVNGGPGGPTSWTASIPFQLPPGGGSIFVAIAEVDPGSNQLVTSTDIRLQVAPPIPGSPQEIVIELPVRGARVGSPLAIEGRAARMPPGSQLGWQVLDLRRNVLGSGQIGVTNNALLGPIFVGSLAFNTPPAGTPVVVEVFERDAASGAIAALATVEVVMGP